MKLRRSLLSGLLKLLIGVWFCVALLFMYSQLHIPGLHRLQARHVTAQDTWRHADQVILPPPAVHPLPVEPPPPTLQSSPPDPTTACPTLFTASQQDAMEKYWPPKAKPGDAGYDGEPVVFNRTQLTERDRQLYDQGLSQHNINQFVSDVIPLRREISFHMPECQNLSYLQGVSLPTVGVVLIFTDEIWSVLLRTVFSILDASPAHLLTEIVLVDDASQQGDLGLALDEYIRIFQGKVKLVRLPRRSGLITARLAGFDHVTGEVVVFLDAHCEVHKGWLEPLLARIQSDDNVVVTPFLEVLDRDTFKIQKTPNQNYNWRFGFDFDMKYTWIESPARKSLADPLPSAAHMGCCLATSKKNFERLGRYDPGLEIWGCENTELSFKTWMCGGRIELIPCSHVAHLYKNGFFYHFDNNKYFYEKNCLRVAEVWMDQYKVFYQDRVSSLQSVVDIGDLSQRKALREKLKCRSFEWYVKEVLGTQQIFLPLNTSATGRIVNVKNPFVCVNLRDGDMPRLGQCELYREDQYFYLTTEKQIRRDRNCLSYEPFKKHLEFISCKLAIGQWEYTQDNMITVQGHSLCLALAADLTQPVMTSCNISDTSQRWNWPRRSIAF